MRCQMPGCKNEVNEESSKDGVFCGLHLEHVSIYTCGNHSEEEVENALTQLGEEEASAIQSDCNPFVDASKSLKHKQ